MRVMQVERPLLDRDKDRKVTIENMIVHKYLLRWEFFIFSFHAYIWKKIKVWTTRRRGSSLKLHFITAIKMRH